VRKADGAEHHTAKIAISGKKREKTELECPKGGKRGGKSSATKSSPSTLQKRENLTQSSITDPTSLETEVWTPEYVGQGKVLARGSKQPKAGWPAPLAFFGMKGKKEETYFFALAVRYVVKEDLFGRDEKAPERRGKRQN